ncbi:MAG: response regulator, partial [Rhodoferax sp.]
MTITVKMLSYLLVAGILPLMFLGLTAFEISKRIVISQAEEENTRLVASFSSYLQLYWDQVEDLAANIAGNTNIGSALQRVDEQAASSFEALDMRAQMGYILNSYVRVKGLVSIDVFSVGGAHFHVGDTLDASRVDESQAGSLLRQALSAKTPLVWLGIVDKLNRNSAQKKVIGAVRAIHLFSPESGKSEAVGVLMISLNDEIMRNFLAGVPLAPGVQLMQLDRHGNMELHSDLRRFGQPLSADLLALVHAREPVTQLALDGQEVLLKVSQMDQQQRQLVVVSPRQLLTQKVDQLAYATLVVLCISLGGVLAITWHFARRVARPIRAVSEGFHQIESNPDRLHQPLPTSSAHDEIDQLVDGYNRHLASMQITAELGNKIAGLNQRFALAADAARIGVWEYFIEQDRLVWDKWMFFLYGLREDEFIGAYQAWRAGLHPDDLVRGDAEIAQAIRGEKEFDTEFRVIWPSGEVRHIKAAAQVLRAVDGKALRMIGVNYDITERKRIEDELRQARDLSESATLAKSQFLANMSHEIRTPMNAILGMLKLLQGTDLSERQLDYASKTEGAAKSLLGLLNDILDFSKMEAGKMALDRQPFRLDRLLRDLSVILSANVGKKPIEMLFDVDPAIPKALIGDSMRLQQVLINLSGNAIKFTAHGEVMIQIKVLAVKDDATELRFSVIDSGIGIAPENQKHIFDGFSQAEASTSRRFGGTGLGLSISKRLVALMGGQLTLQSALGEGSTFSFTLALPSCAQVPADPDLPLERAIEPLQVLVVDDNAIARDLLVTMARSWGWQADTAADGAQAVAAVQARDQAGRVPFDAIFMDWEMPGMDGWEAIRQLRLVNPMAADPITIMVTAHGREMLTQRSAQEQARLNAFLVKPITASMLFDAVAQARADRNPLRPGVKAKIDKVGQLVGMRLLVVEDNLINQQVALELLSAEGAQVEIAENGQLGVAAVAHADPMFDAVLMDIQMPVMDGYQATQVIRHGLGLTELPVIAMTANAMASDRAACLEAGMNDHVGKPFDLQHLIAMLQSYTGRATLPEPLQAATVVALAPVCGLQGLMPALPAQDAVDLSGALARLGNNRSLYDQVLQSYLQEIITLPDQLEQLLASGNRKDAVRLLHTLKGLAATVGASYMTAVAKALEAIVKDADAQWQ